MCLWRGEILFAGGLVLAGVTAGGACFRYPALRTHLPPPPPSVAPLSGIVRAMECGTPDGQAVGCSPHLPLRV
jgi:hypothetical protein